MRRLTKSTTPSRTSCRSTTAMYLSCSSPVWRARGHHWWKAFWEQCGSKARLPLLGAAGLANEQRPFSTRRMALDLPASKLMTEAAKAEVSRHQSPA